MATYDSLTVEQKADLGRYDTFLRGVFSSLAHLAAEADGPTWNQFAVDNVDAVVDSLDPGERIPSSTGLAGAKPLTKEEFQTLQQIARGLMGTQEESRPLLVKAVGVNAG